MIQKIINNGRYKFDGDIDDLKKCISSFRVTKIICDTKVQDAILYEAFGKFRYHGQWHRIKISTDWTNKNIAYIQYYGIILDN